MTGFNSVYDAHIAERIAQRRRHRFIFKYRKGKSVALQRVLIANLEAYFFAFSTGM